MVKRVTHEDGGLDLIDGCGSESYRSVGDTLVGITTTAEGDIKDLGTLKTGLAADSGSPNIDISHHT